jgi:HK97 family phage major capsid protein
MPPTRAAPGPVTQATWPSVFPPEVGPIVSMIVAGSPFARSLTPMLTGRTGVSFPLVDDVSEPSWGKELDVVPTLDLEGGEYDVAVSRLSGSILISEESISDTDYPLTASVQQVIEDKFSNKLERDFIGAAGPFPVPTGILAVAAEVAGADLELAAVSAKAQIGENGGEADSIAMSPTLIGTLESARDTLGRALYPDAATTFAGLSVVRSVAATQAICYDSRRLWIVINRDFTADFSRETSEAWNRYARSLRIVGRFALAAPMPVKSVRKLTVTGPGAGGAPETPARARK